jgi:thioredoxin reductase (NADPH)
MVGGGDSAIESAIGLARQKGNKVSISYRKDKFYRIKKKNEERITELIRKGKVTPYFNSDVTRIDDTSVLITVDGSKIELANDYVFVNIGGEPPFQFLQQIGVQFGGKK